MIVEREITVKTAAEVQIRLKNPQCPVTAIYIGYNITRMTVKLLTVVDI